MLFGMSISSWANSQLKEIKAYLNGELRIQMDGQFVQLKDGDGNEVLPVSYNGTTYLPIRGVSQLLDVGVHYDGKNKIITLGDLDGATPPKDEQNRDGTIELVSWSDRTENGEVIVTGSVRNRDKTGKTIGMVATAYDKNGKELAARGSSNYVSSGSVRNYEVIFDETSDIEEIKVDVTGYATSVRLLSAGDRVKDGKIEVTGVVENGEDSGKTAGIVATGYNKEGKAIETRGTSNYISSGSTRNFSVELDAVADIAYVEVKATGYANKVELLSDGGYLQDGKFVVTAVVENGLSEGETTGIVVTGYTKDGKAVDTRGTSNYKSR